MPKCKQPKKEKEGSGLKPNNHQTPVQEEDGINGEGHQVTQGKEQQTNVEAKTPINPAGDYSSGQHKGNDGSNEEEEGEEKDDETEKEREEQNQENPPGKEQETKTGANATNQPNTMPGDNDGSTAVSHTASPLLLLVVACAAAAVVAA
ncbi:mucin-associated surface protein (MASP) [Trypanosoma cruzi]|nr:mucin-associated surface protein (MASP) [Trypanosoma cruzi]